MRFVPARVRECNHHHYACYCREWQARQLRRSLQYIEKRCSQWLKERNSDPEQLIQLVHGVCEDSLRSFAEMRRDRSTPLIPVVRGRKRRVIDQLRARFPHTWWWSFRDRCWECAKFRVYPRNPDNLEGEYDSTLPTIYFRSDTGEILDLFPDDRIPEYFSNLESDEVDDGR